MKKKFVLSGTFSTPRNYEWHGPRGAFIWAASLVRRRDDTWLVTFEEGNHEPQEFVIASPQTGEPFALAKFRSWIKETEKDILTRRAETKAKGGAEVSA